MNFIVPIFLKKNILSMDFGDLKDYVIEMTSHLFPLTFRYGGKDLSIDWE
jgi:hypothetical protein